MKRDVYEYTIGLQTTHMPSSIARFTKVTWGFSWQATVQFTAVVLFLVALHGVRMLPRGFYDAHRKLPYFVLFNAVDTVKNVSASEMLSIAAHLGVQVFLKSCIQKYPWSVLQAGVNV